MELQVGVKILLKNKEGRFLLVQRNPKKYPEVGDKWDIVGGRVEPGASLLDNLKREIKEEVGLAYVGAPKLLAVQDILRIEGRHVVRLTYGGEIQGELRVDEEHLEAKWFSREEMTNFENLDFYLKELLEKGIIVL